jgi:UDP-N-acetylmuramoylalanine-D-glutamate ligase
MARPTKLTPEVQAAICAHVRAGGYTKTAARAAGVARDTFHEWMRRGVAEEAGPYRDFYDAVERARAEHELDLIALLRKAAPKAWKAAAFLLDRADRQRAARLDRAKTRAETKVLEAKAAGELPPDTVVLSPGDAAFDQLMREKWGGPRQGTTPPATPSEGDDPDGREPQT